MRRKLFQEIIKNEESGFHNKWSANTSKNGIHKTRLYVFEAMMYDFHNIELWY